VGIAVLRDAFDRGAAGIAKAEQFCGLVERLARGVVDRRREPAVIADALDEQQLAMAPRYEEQQIGEGEAGFDEARAERMAFEMINRDQRLVRGVRQRLSGDEPDHDAADQPGSCGRSDRVYVR
jgi:hypothetical protein